jgi:hypothetical protein
MAVRPLNSIAGFSTGDPAITVVQANGDVTTINFTANGVSNLGNVGNVKITGGSNGQAITTDGNGNLTFTTFSTESNRAAPMPYLIPTGESYIVNENFQGLYSQPITIDGELTVDGILIEVGFSVNADDNQVYYDINGVPTGTEGFTFNPSSLVLSTPGNISANGGILPQADATYDLGRANLRWRDGYFSGNTIYIGNSSISVDSNGFIVLRNELGGSFTVEGTSPSDTSEIENGSSNVKVLANGNVTFNIAGVANILQVTSAGANLTGNLTAGGIKTNNLYYANGTAWDLQNPGGSNTQIQFNNNGDFGASNKFTFDTSTDNLSLTGNLVVSTGTLYGNAAGLTNIPGANISGNISGNISNAAHAVTSNTVIDAAQPNITSLGTLTGLSVNGNISVTGTANITDLAVSGNAVVGGNLQVNGNLIYINVEEFSVEDPIVNLNTGANGTPPVSNSGKDIGTALNYYDTQARIAFMGWDVSNAEFAFGSQTSITGEVVTFNTLGNVRAQTFKGNVEATTISGNLTTATQSNITTLGTLGSLSVTGNVTPGNVLGANTVSGNFLVSNSGCVSINGAFLAYNNNTGTGGIFTSGVTDINFGLAANITMGSTSGDVTARGNLIANNISTTGNINANLITGTLTTAAQANITTVGTLGNLSVTNNIAGNLLNSNVAQTNSIQSKRSSVPVTVLTVIDSFSASDFRTAKYVISSQNDNGFESLEVLLVHNSINSYVTVYGAINDGGGNTVTLSTGINSGNVELRATGTAGNTQIKLIGTYVPVI